MTRTVKFEKDPDALTNPKLLVAVGYYEAIEDMHISIKAVQFSKRRGECPLEQILRAGTGQLLRCTVE